MDGIYVVNVCPYHLSHYYIEPLLDMAKKKGLWANIHAKRKRGEAPAKKGDKNYPDTLDIDEGSMKTARKNVGADKCWDGYTAKGTKKKDGKTVPNCVKEVKTFAEFCEQAGDGYIGPRSLKIKNPMASDANRAATDAKAKATAKKRLASGGKTTGNIVDRIQQRKEMINSIGEETVTIEDAEGNSFMEIVNLIAPGPMTGWRQDVVEKLDVKKPQWGT